LLLLLNTFSFKYKLKCTALASELCWKFCRGSG